MLIFFLFLYLNYFFFNKNKQKYDKKLLVLHIALLNLLFISFEFSYFNNFYIEINYSNVKYYGMVITVYLVLLVTTKIVKHKWLNYFSELLQYFLIFFLFYLLYSHLNCLGISIFEGLVEKDLLYQNRFFSIYRIYTKEYLFAKIESLYALESKIQAKLTDEIKSQILGDAKTMEDLQNNINAYCKKENEIKLAMENSYTYKIKNFYHQKPAYVIGATALCLLLIISGYPSDLTVVKSTINDLIVITQDLITIELSILKRAEFVDKEKILYNLVDLFRYLKELKRNLR